MKITTVGLDLAKSVFQVHAVDGRGKVALRKQLKRSEKVSFFANLPSCLIGMEACSGAHYWARKLEALGHEVRLMAPQFVKPYVKTNKNDRNDAEAICEAVTRPNMRFVPVKTQEQQTVLALHRARAACVKARTAQANQLRGLLAEFGIVLPQGIGHLYRQIPDILADGNNTLSGTMRALLQRLVAQLKQLDQQVAELMGEIVTWHWHDEDSLRLERIGGFGPLTASA
jgi:transposase